MEMHLKKSMALFALAIAYAILFYQGEMGINLFLFDGLLILLALRLRPELAGNRPFIWSVAGLLFAAGSVVVVHSDFSLMAHHGTYLLVLGFAQSRELRFVWFGLLLGAISLVKGPINWAASHHNYLKERLPKRGAGAMKWMGQAIFSLAIAGPFLIFYLLGNSEFANGLEQFFNLFLWIRVDENALWVSILLLLAVILSAGLLFPRTTPSTLVNYQVDFRDDLIRGHPGRQPTLPAPDFTLHQRPRPNRNPLALRHEYRQSVITFGLLNLLLAAVNFTDLRYVWLNTGELSASTLSHYVHVGTWNLVLSIFLAMAVVLFYFRGNLNFLREATALKPLAQLWLAQNALLTVSVGIRNWHYIDAYGLAMGRIYIGLVLLLILFGLWTLWRKVDRRLTISYLFQANGMAIWMALLLLGAVNWTSVVTRYNLAVQEPEEVDWYYLVNELPQENAFLIQAYDEQNPGKPSVAGMHFKMLPVAHKIADWRSWNYADWRNAKALR